MGRDGDLPLKYKAKIGISQRNRFRRLDLFHYQCVVLFFFTAGRVKFFQTTAMDRYCRKRAF
jgi:hypothetical protein